jgi:alpha-beta hydrolase superfamily lysophospholipase
VSETQAERFAREARERDQAEKPKAPARGWRYYARRAVIDLIAGYVVLCLILFFFQKKFIYMPTHESSLNPQASGFAAQQAREVEARTSDGVTIRGWHIAAHRSTADLAHAPLVELFFCGNAGNRSDRSSTFQRAASLGLHVVCFDYRGYGDSDGSPDEDGLAADARAAWDSLIQHGVKPQNIVIHGESLGGAVAIRLAAEMCAAGTPPGGLITEATFTRLKDVAGRHYWFVPVSLILLLHGQRDEVVPFALGQELFAAAPPQSAAGVAKQFVELPNCHHNDVGIWDASEYLNAISAFYEKLCPALAAKRAADGAPHPPRDKRPPRPQNPPKK